MQDAKYCKNQVPTFKNYLVYFYWTVIHK